MSEENMEVLNKPMLITLPDCKPELIIDKEFFETRNNLVKSANDLTEITTQEDFDKGGEILKFITKQRNSAEKIRKQFAKPYQDAAKFIKKTFDEQLSPYDNTKVELQVKLNKYADILRQKQLEEEKQIAEKEKKIAEEAVDKAIEAEDIFGEAENIEVVMPDIKPEIQKARGVSVKVVEKIEWEVIDESKVHRGLMSYDKTKILEWMKGKKDIIKDKINSSEEKFVISNGIKFWIKTNVSSR